MRCQSFMLIIMSVIGIDVNSVFRQGGRELFHPLFYICEHNISKAYCRKDRELCDTSSGKARCVCADGWGGKRCDEDIDECVGRYPCPGIKNVNSICIDHDPPIRYRCECVRGYKPVYNSSKSDAYSTYHPINCIKDSCANNPCHPDATCYDLSGNGFACLCKNGFVGDGITSCSSSPTTFDPIVKPPANPIPKDTSLDDKCTLSSECTVLNSHCVIGKCACKDGFLRRKSECVNINECEIGYMNRCHRNAFCFDTSGSYMCKCKDGFRDKDVLKQPGIACVQTNECLTESTHSCNLETEVCVDQRPPLKWKCIKKTQAPTKLPTRRFVPPQPRCGRARKLQVVTPAPVTPAPVTKAPITQAPTQAPIQAPTQAPTQAPVC